MSPVEVENQIESDMSCFLFIFRFPVSRSLVRSFVVTRLCLFFKLFCEMFFPSFSHIFVCVRSLFKCSVTSYQLLYACYCPTSYFLWSIYPSSFIFYDMQTKRFVENAQRTVNMFHVICSVQTIGVE